ncbi:MAG: HAMP domain-containing sensor histidine kinase [bacterium]|nr:HAMP domain-containing sensor histidine kinase [bacterium]MDD5354627.1 HAMP domain-containing sensor histidine kinase [bacterium]MDD5756649.1 HAMP domain-containing sensor histidine kinase [bacterium]
MKSKKVTTDFFILFAFITVITLGHYFSPVDNVFLHNVFRKLYFIPIIFAAFKLGPIGVVASALISSFFYMLRIWPPPPQLGSSWMLDNCLEIILYIIVGLTVNILVQFETRGKTALEKAHRDLLKKEQMKSKFISIASHEFRTPLTVLNGYISLFELGMFKGKDDEFKQKCGKAKEIINRYLQTIDNVLDMVKTEQKDKLEKRDQTNLNDLIKEVYSDLEIFAQKRKQSLVLDLDQKLPLAKMNKREMNQVLTNLVMNAIKFTQDEGKITIKTKTFPDRIQAEITDTGIGIPENEFENIFESFYEVKSDDQHSSGTFEFKSGSLGLGLTLVKRIIENYQGKVWVESVVGKGSTFYFTVPLEKAEGKK